MATCSDGPKISNLVSETSDAWFSFEYFPPKTQKGLSYLKQKVQRMKSLGPLFTGFTWGTGESTAKATIELTNTAQNELGCVANMHLTCTSENTKVAGEALAACKNMGVRNIVALRGDPPHGQQQWAAFEGGFGGVLDLVKFIRDKHGEYFCISVAGYPEGHPDTISVVEGGPSGAVTQGSATRSSVAGRRRNSVPRQGLREGNDIPKRTVRRRRRRYHHPNVPGRAGVRGIPRSVPRTGHLGACGARHYVLQHSSWFRAHDEPVQDATSFWSVRNSKRC